MRAVKRSSNFPGHCSQTHKARGEKGDREINGIKGRMDPKGFYLDMAEKCMSTPVWEGSHCANISHKLKHFAFLTFPKWVGTIVCTLKIVKKRRLETAKELFTRNCRLP